MTFSVHQGRFLQDVGGGRPGQEAMHPAGSTLRHGARILRLRSRRRGQRGHGRAPDGHGRDTCPDGHPRGLSHPLPQGKRQGRA